MSSSFSYFYSSCCSPAFANFHATANPSPRIFPQILNEVVIWDRIVSRKEEAHLQIVAPKNWGKYPIIDQRTELRGRLLNLTLHWDVMPYTGILYFGTAPSTHVVRLPGEYCLSEAPCSFTEVQSV